MFSCIAFLLFSLVLPYTHLYLFPYSPYPLSSRQRYPPWECDRSLSLLRRILHLHEGTRILQKTCADGYLRGYIYVEFKKNHFFCLKCPLGIKKLIANGLIPRNVLFSKSQLSISNASQSRLPDFELLNAFFSKLHFSTRLAVELKQFLSDRLEISTVSLRLNHLQKCVGFFWYVENRSGNKAFFTIFLRERRIFLKTPSFKTDFEYRNSFCCKIFPKFILNFSSLTIYKNHKHRYNNGLKKYS